MTSRPTVGPRSRSKKWQTTITSALNETVASHNLQRHHLMHPYCRNAVTISLPFGQLATTGAFVVSIGRLSERSASIWTASFWTFPIEATFCLPRRYNSRPREGADQAKLSFTREKGLGTAGSSRIYLSNPASRSLPLVPARAGRNLALTSASLML